MRKMMAAVALCGLALCGAAVAETPRLDGHWEGTIELRPGEFEIFMKLDLVRAADGSLSGRLSYPDQGPKEYALDTVKVDDDHVFFTSTDEQKVVSVFQARSLEGGKLLRGDLTEGGRKAPFEFRRTAAVPARKLTPMQTLSRDGAELKALFNQEQGMVRVLMILSPVCPTCRMGARMVVRHLLERSFNPGLSVYILWERIGSQDSLETASNAAALLPDPRIHHFWSPDAFAGTAFQGPIGFEQSTAWDVFLVFGKGKKWLGSPPVFDAFMHNQKQHRELPKDRLLNAEKLGQEVKVLLGAPAAGR
ncbi:MAG: hypothetical protein WAM82_08555 [Thermoanaerobaculia bacterium]